MISPCEIELPSGEYTITASKAGYVSRSVPITYDETLGADVHIVLQAEEATPPDPPEQNGAQGATLNPAAMVAALIGAGLLILLVSGGSRSKEVVLVAQHQ